MISLRKYRYLSVGIEYGKEIKKKIRGQKQRMYLFETAPDIRKPGAVFPVLDVNEKGNEHDKAVRDPPYGVGRNEKGYRRYERHERESAEKGETGDRVFVFVFESAGKIAVINGKLREKKSEKDACADKRFFVVKSAVEPEVDLDEIPDLFKKASLGVCAAGERGYHIRGGFKSS